jgi:uncharacterized membrane protein
MTERKTIIARMARSFMVVILLKLPNMNIIFGWLLAYYFGCSGTTTNFLSMTR